MRRGKNIAFVIAIAIFAPIVFLFAGSVVGVVFTGVGLAVFGWIMSRPSGRQVIGEKCAHCRVVVTLEYEAEICRECSAGLHARCLESHRANAHPAPTAPPYR